MLAGMGPEDDYQALVFRAYLLRVELPFAVVGKWLHMDDYIFAKLLIGILWLECIAI